MTVVLVLTACGGGGSSSSASFCDDYAELQGLSGTDQATLQRAADLFRKVAAASPSEAKADFTVVAVAAGKVADGEALSVDNDAVSAAAGRADVVAQKECAGK
ncbi:MAG: hypothetical protein QOG87_3970 [Actinomycetota bacterium]|jgi:hypothetical protein